MARLLLILLPAVGCSVSGNGLGSHADASDGPRKTSDVPPEATGDASPTLPEANSDGIPSPPEAGRADLAPLDLADSSPDRAPSPDVPGPGPDLLAQDFPPVGDVPLGFEVQIVPDTIQAKDGNDAPPAVDLDGPANVPLDGPALDRAPLDTPKLDVAPEAVPPDLPLTVDLPSPDLPPPDLAPLPTSDWVIDNTTSIDGQAPTVMGTPTVTAMDAGRAVCFDGTADGLLFDTNPIQGMQAFTVQTLVYPEIAGNPQPRVIHLGGPGANDDRLVIQMRPDGASNWHLLVGFYWNGTNTTIEDTAAIHPSNQWYWLAVTYDGQTARVYVNGVLEDSTNLIFGPMAAGSMSLATRQNGANYFPGCMREVEFFNTALAATKLHVP